MEAVDTTGCGDAFAGTLMMGLAQGLGLEESVGTACAVGAYAATSLGAQPSYPTAAQLESFLREQQWAGTAAGSPDASATACG